MIETNRIDRIAELSSEVRRYLLSHKWCDRVMNIYLAADCVEVVFLAEIGSRTPGVDPQVWVITGDVPLSYIDIQICTHPLDALCEYCILAEAWVRYTLKRRDTSNSIQLKEHGSLRLLTSDLDAKQCLPLLYGLATRLIETEAVAVAVEPEILNAVAKVKVATAPPIPLLKTSAPPLDAEKRRPIDTTSFQEIDFLDHGAIPEFADEARKYLLKQAWCDGVDRVFFAAEFGALVFLIEVVTPSHLESQVWVVTGGAPISYLHVRNYQTPIEALATYCLKTSMWISDVMLDRDSSSQFRVCHHRSLRELRSLDEAHACIPIIGSIVDRLISDKLAFDSLSSSSQKGLARVLDQGKRWSEENATADFPLQETTGPIDSSDFERLDFKASGPRGELAREVRRYLLGQPGCDGVLDLYLAADYDAVVILADISSTRRAIDPQVWVITGDVPLSYIDIQSSKSPLEALGLYCVLTCTWIEKTLGRENTDDCIVLTEHGSFDRLRTADEAKSCIPGLKDVIARLSADASAFQSLARDRREDLMQVEIQCNRWIRDFRL